MNTFPRFPVTSKTYKPPSQPRKSVPSRAWSGEQRGTPNKDRGSGAEALDWAGRHWGLRVYPDWLSAQKAHFAPLRTAPGSPELPKTPSVHRMVSAHYHGYLWQEWQFAVIREGFWKDARQQEQYVEWLSVQVGIVAYPDWYGGDTQLFLGWSGNGAVVEHNYNVQSLLEGTLRAFPWQAWRFKKPHKGYWRSSENQSHYVDQLLSNLNLDSFMGVIGCSHLLEFPFTTKSIPRVLYSIYPQLVNSFPPWTFPNSLHGTWQPKTTPSPPPSAPPQSDELEWGDQRRVFLDWVGQKEPKRRFSDWHSINFRTFSEEWSASLLVSYGNSPFHMLREVYPEFQWLPWMFSSSAREFWKDQELVNCMVVHMEDKLGVQELEDWYRITQDHLNHAGTAHTVKQLGGLKQLLLRVYPDFPWDHQLLERKMKKSGQWQLFSAVKEIFASEEVLEEYHHDLLRFKGSNKKMQLDVYVPSQGLAFEYQGELHYWDSSYFGATRFRQERDKEKLLTAARHGIRIIQVPYWWKGEKEVLEEWIKGTQTQTESEAQNS